MPIINTVIAGGGSPTPTPARYVAYDVSSGVLNKSTSNTLMDFTGVTELADNALVSAYENNQNIGAVDLSNVTTFGYGSLYRAFAGSSITSVNLNGLTSVPQRSVSSLGTFRQAFAGCTSLVSASADNLQSVGGGDTSALASVHLGWMFDGCTSLQSFVFTALNSVANYGLMYMFSNCSNISISFPAAKTTTFSSNSLRYMCSGATNVTLHFPSNVQSQVEALSGYSATAPFSATSGSVLFDLPATA